MTTTVPTKDGLRSGVTEVDYHADRGSLSASRAKMLLPPSNPAKFKEAMDNPPPPKREFDFGHVAHRLVLREGVKFAVLDPAVHGLKKDGTVADSPRATATWKAAEADARLRDETPIHVDTFTVAEQMAQAVKAHPRAAELFLRGHAETSLYWTDDQTGVRLRGRPDWLTLMEFDGQQRPTVVDYKTTADANPAAWVRKAYDYGYHIQFAWYCLGYQAIQGEMPAFFFVVQEKTRPYLVSVIELDAEAFALGAQQMRRAIDLYAECVKTDTWPGYGEQIHSMSLPPWAFTSDAPILSDLFNDTDDEGGLPE